MSRLHLSFSGEAKYTAVKDVGGKSVLEFQIAKKNYSKEKLSKEDEQWTNVRVSMYDAKQSDIDRIKDGVFVSGSGEFSVRSYVDKAGVKKQSIEVRVPAFGLDTAFVLRGQSEATLAAKVPHRIAPADIGGGASDTEPPFLYDLGADAWG